jgi:hypothetical protein
LLLTNYKHVVYLISHSQRGFYHLLSHTNKCTNYILYYLKSVLIIDVKKLSYFHSSYIFLHITCHPQGALMFLAKITGKQFVKHEHILCEGTVAHTARMHTRIHDMLPHPSHNMCSCFTNCLPVILARNMSAP